MLYEIKISFNTFNIKMIHEAIEFVLSSCSQYTILGTVYSSDCSYTLVSTLQDISGSEINYIYTKAPTYENRTFIPVSSAGVEISIYEASDEDLHKYDLKGSE